MIYRIAKKEDCKILDDMLTKLIKDEHDNYDPSCELITVKDYYINYVDDNTKYLYLAEDNNIIIGYIYIIIDNNKAKIDALYVNEDYRNQGIATKLINDSISYLKEKNIKQISINVLSNNIKAKSIYLKYFKPFKEELRLEVDNENK